MSSKRITKSKAPKATPDVDPALVALYRAMKKEQTDVAHEAYLESLTSMSDAELRAYVHVFRRQPAPPGCSLNAQGFPKANKHQPTDEQVRHVLELLTDYVDEKLSEYALGAVERGEVRSSEQVLSVADAAKRFTDLVLPGEATTLGYERAYLIVGQLLLGRPLGWNLPGFAQQVSFWPFAADVKKALPNHIALTLAELLKELLTEHEFAVVEHAEHAVEHSKRAGARHCTINTLVKLEKQNTTLVLRLTPKKGKPTGKPESSPNAQIAAGGGGGGAKPESSGVAQ